MGNLLKLVAAALLLVGATGAKAKIDASKVTTCAVHSAHSCSPGVGCGAISPGAAGLPNFVSVDFAKQIVLPLGNMADKRTSKIQSMTTIDGKITVQGVEDGAQAIVDGAGWTASIDKKSGHMVVTMASAPDSLVLFGACITQ